jgi:Ca-activated chloride channel family protein
MKTQSVFRQMRKNALLMCGLALSTLFGSPQATQRQGMLSPAPLLPPIEGEGNKTLSPYFFVMSDDPTTDRLPLKETRADIKIAGVIADVTVTQVYKNEGKNTLEAIYIFPASTRAAVYDMKMTIGEREIFAVVQERNKARQNYEQAKQEGKTASLLEQQRPNVFQMNVANILPGDIIKVEMKYTELLIPEAGVYEFIYPTVVGPRYSNQSADQVPASEQWVSNPYTHEGEKPMYTFGLHATLSTGLPIQDVRCNSHQIDITYQDKSVADISLKSTETSAGNKDFVLQYRLAGNQIESGLLLYKGKEENFFLAMIQPPRVVTDAVIPPREYVFIVDVSGSMYGFPLDISKKLLRDIIGKLRPMDRFNILFFAGGSSLFAEQSVPATGENIQKAIQMLDSQQGGGGTELLSALQQALSLKGTEGFSRSFVIATDGYVTVEREAFDLIRKNLGEANFFTFGIGSSVNRYLIEGLAHVGMGIPFVVTNESEAEPLAAKFRNYIQNPVLTKINIHYNGFETYDVEPLSVPDVLAERPVIVYGKWRGNATGSIELTGKSGDRKYNQALTVNPDLVSEKNSGLRYLWARERIRLLDDYSNLDGQGSELSEQIISLGLKYNLLTQYTSFIAIDSEVRNAGGNVTTVKQPLPLPEGVSNYAVGGVALQSASGNFSRAKSVPMAAEAKADYTYDEEKKTEDDSNATWVSAEVMPEYKGGIEVLKKFIADNLRVPEDLKAKGITGKVFVQFTVDKDGSIVDIKVIRSLHADLDKEAMRVIALTSKMWKPGMQGKKPVRVSMVIPVDFK